MGGAFLFYGLLVFGALLLMATALSLLRRDAWWIRAFDFPRPQTLIGLTLVAAVWGALFAAAGPWPAAFLTLLVLALGYQAWRLFPYSPLARVQVLDAERGEAVATLSLMVANVLIDNHEYERFLALARRVDPDLILVLEGDDGWQEHLHTLVASHPHGAEVPLDNAYGMHLYSRRELRGTEVRYLVRDDVPSIHAEVVLEGDRRAALHCLHPEPPAPQEATSTTERDAELLQIGRAVDGEGTPTVVAGDLNDVSWAYTTDLFQRVSGLLDPRVGRGTFGTFSPSNPLFRWPLDHVFVSHHWKLLRFERLPPFGSDHFALLAELALVPHAPEEHDKPEPADRDLELAEEKIAAVED